jgi:hypothetical protein
MAGIQDWNGRQNDTNLLIRQRHATEVARDPISHNERWGFCLSEPGNPMTQTNKRRYK